MKCICCGTEGELVKSHVISNFIRKALTGIESIGGKKYEFNFYQRPDLPRQDLPKPKLLCALWDNKFGADIERLAASVLFPKGDLTNVATWHKLPFRYKELLTINGKSFNVAQYQIADDVQDCALSKFTVLTAWRALHAMKVNGDLVAIDFLDSLDGQHLQAETVKYLKEATPRGYMHYPYYSQLYFLGPNSAVALSGADDEAPFGWTFLDAGEQKGVAVIFSYWVIIWSLIPDGDPRGCFKNLLSKTFLDWLIPFSQALRQNRMNF